MKTEDFTFEIVGGRLDGQVTKQHCSSKNGQPLFAKMVVPVLGASDLEFTLGDQLSNGNWQLIPVAAL